MHQTTVRFSAELWSMLEIEAESAGVSAAQYIRDAALARLAYAAGQRSVEDLSFAWADPRMMRADRGASESFNQLDAANAVQAQARLASARSQHLRERSSVVRGATGRRSEA